MHTAWRPHSWKINQPGGRFEITQDLACVERRKSKRKCDCKVFPANRCDPGEVHSAIACCRGTRLYLGGGYSLLLRVGSRSYLATAASSIFPDALLMFPQALIVYGERGSDIRDMPALGLWCHCRKGVGCCRPNARFRRGLKRRSSCLMHAYHAVCKSPYLHNHNMHAL